MFFIASIECIADSFMLALDPMLQFKLVLINIFFKFTLQSDMLLNQASTYVSIIFHFHAFNLKDTEQRFHELYFFKYLMRASKIEFYDFRRKENDSVFHFTGIQTIATSPTCVKDCDCLLVGGGASGLLNLE